MALSKRERKALAFYAAHRGRPPTMKEFVPKLALMGLIHVVLQEAIRLIGRLVLARRWSAESYSMSPASLTTAMPYMLEGT
jgi:hypothetical protein